MRSKAHCGIVLPRGRDMFFDIKKESNKIVFHLHMPEDLSSNEEVIFIINDVDGEKLFKELNIKFGSKDFEDRFAEMLGYPSKAIEFKEILLQRNIKFDVSYKEETF